MGDRRYRAPLNWPVLGMALACWVLVALVVWLLFFL